MKTPQAIFFDINETLLDINAMKPGLSTVLGNDESIVELWFTQLLHHSLVEIASSQFHDFIDIGAATLIMVAHSRGIVLDGDTAKATIKKHITALPAHADVAPTLTALHSKGIKLVALSNSSEKGLHAQLEFANIKHYFHQILSVETLGIYKPHPQVYHWACRQANVKNEDAIMVAAHGWDVSGAKATGMKTIFVERPGKMMYPLGLSPDHAVKTMTELDTLVMPSYG
ncbi:haloacid dehalogenase type II [Alteromonas sp. D210916BOD_24]|uniref:haloacid dehalogenase type II n=1 Tax=Alteromonas sp. D210916BOD_24 TaxID=3157618 RepID=UPI00399D2CB1